GKGGTGKTTISALLVEALIGAGEAPVLAVDADPNANLNEALGLPLGETLGSMREDAFTKSIPPGMSRTGYIEYRFQQVLVESDGVDLLAMGRPEGTGCYCFANRLLSEAMDLLTRHYRFVVMDMEAGMEHFSRGTIGIPDILLVVTDPGARGVRTARRIHDLAITLGIPKEKIFFVINRAGEAGKVTPDKAPWAAEAGVAGGGGPGMGTGGGSGIGVGVASGGSSAAGTESLPDPSRILASIPDDPEVERADLDARPIVSIPAGSPARNAVRELAERVRSLCLR
ncbi:MAG TPA: AAA family ATPase, partial [Methanomicrobiales archaeon]|nr:AAA family ATPase [Methanomicrobiales archaeon]